jgi:hypothetical protein
VEMTCAQCALPFVVEPTTTVCPHCSSTKAARCQHCGESIALQATTCVRHSDLGQHLPYRDAEPATSAEPGPDGAAGSWQIPASPTRADPPPAARRRRWPASWPGWRS